MNINILTWDIIYLSQIQHKDNVTLIYLDVWLDIFLHRTVYLSIYI